MVTLSWNTALRCDVPPNTALRVRERIRPLYRESLGGFANPSGGQSLRSLGGRKSHQTFESGSSAGDFNHADTAASRISYVWGPDLGSGTDGHASWQKAGGVRGLLAVLGTTDNLKQFPLMERLGNVTGYKKAIVSPGPAVLDALIEYDAFGREVRSTGPASDAMPFRFSTKYTDPESGLVYYGYRFYDPDRGRWVNRDPVNELGFRTFGEKAKILFIKLQQNINLFNFNNGICFYDINGLGNKGLLGGKCCNTSADTQFGLVGDGQWKSLKPGECTGSWEDCDGMTCGGGFYYVEDLDGGSCNTPGSDCAKYRPRRWTPGNHGPDARSPGAGGGTPDHRGASNNEPPVGYTWQ